MKWIATALVAAAIVALALMPAEAHGRRCSSEDQILVLERLDESHSHWTCVHTDDFIAEAIENNYRNTAVHATVVGSVCEHRRFWRHQGIEPAVTETCH